MWDKGKKIKINKKNSLWHKSNVFYFTTTSSEGNQWKTQEVADHVLPFLPFLVDWCCQSYFCFAEAQGQHISTTVYRVRWLRARRASTLRAPVSLRCPDGPFIPTGWEALTPLSVSQRHSQWHSKGSKRFSDELDQIPTSHLVTHYAAIQHHLCFVDESYHLTSADIFHLKAQSFEIKPFS